MPAKPATMPVEGALTGPPRQRCVAAQSVSAVQYCAHNPPTQAELAQSAFTKQGCPGALASASGVAQTPLMAPPPAA